MSYKRKAKDKDDLRKNPEKINTEIGRKYLKEGKVKILKKCV